MLREGAEGFKGALSAENYVTINWASPATATRDHADMDAKGTVVRVDERRHVRYHVGIPLGPMVPGGSNEHGTEDGSI